jgi:CHAT domain-containing protein
VQRSIHNSLNLHPDKYGLDIINEVTSKGLLNVLNTKDYDIFHFSGHGTVVGGKGRLILNNGDDQSAYVTGEKLAVTLRGRDIRLVVLSACHGASGNFTDDFSVIAKTLVEEGIPAVVANQMPVYDDTIAPFVGTLYSQLLKHGDLDRAVHQGRVALSTAFDDESLAPEEGAPLDWGVPTLYRHISASRMFKV